MPREYPDFPIPTVGAVVFKGEHVLLAQRGRAPNPGLWTLPGGAIELGETIQQAIEREVREECGLHVQAGEVVQVLNMIERDVDGAVRFHYVIIDLLCHYLDGQLAPGDDVADARWVHPSEFSALQVPPRAQAIIAKARRLAGAECRNR